MPLRAALVGHLCAARIHFHSRLDWRRAARRIIMEALYNWLSNEPKAELVRRLWP